MQKLNRISKVLEEQVYSISEGAQSIKVLSKEVAEETKDSAPELIIMPNDQEGAQTLKFTHDTQNESILVVGRNTAAAKQQKIDSAVTATSQTPVANIIRVPLVLEEQHPVEGAQEPSHFQSLEGLRQRKECHTLFANPRSLAVFNPLAATQEVKKAEKLVSYLDTYHQPQCLRFMPSLSSKQVHISLSGLTCQAKSRGQFAVGNMAFSEGHHFWEFICPLGINNIEFGVQSTGSDAFIVSESFKSTTPRSVIIELNLRNQTVLFWLNGKYLKKEKSQALNLPGLAWRPYISMGKDSMVILNPFCRRPPPNPSLAENRSKLPDSLFGNLGHSQITMLEQFIGNSVAVLRLPKSSESVDITEKLTKIAIEGSDFTLLLPEADKQVINSDNVAVVKFGSRPEMIEYIQRASAAKLSIFGPRELARLIHQCRGKTQEELDELYTQYAPFQPTTPVAYREYELGRGSVSSRHAIKAYSLYSEFFEATILPQLSDLQKLLVNSQEKSFSPEKILEIKETKKEHPQTAVSNTIINFSSASNKLIVASGAELKAFDGGNNDWSSFSNYPREPLDTVALNVGLDDLKFLVKCLNLTKVEEVTHAFLDSFTKAYEQPRVTVVYAIAFQGVQSLLAQAIKQYQKLEGIGKRLQVEDKLKRRLIVEDEEQPSPILSYDEANRMLSILLSLEDQLWAMTRSILVSGRVKDLWSPATARVHSTFGRLSSMVGIPDAIKLSELGLVNKQDQLRQFEQFQEPEVAVESIYEMSEQARNSLALSLEKQFLNNMLLKGHPTWNVPLAETLNHLPPSVHRNFLPPATIQTAPQTEVGNIDTLMSGTSSYAMSGSLQHGSINIWSTKLGLNLAGGFNFKKQFHSESTQSAKTETLNHLKLNQYCGGDSSLFLRADKFLGGTENIAKTLKEGQDEVATTLIPMPDIENFYHFLAEAEKAPAPPLIITTDRVGGQEEKNYCFPLEDILASSPYSTLPRVKRLQWCQRHNICNIRFHMSDGTSSPDLGNEYPNDKDYDFGDKEIGKVEITTISNADAIGIITFYSREGTQLVQLKGSPAMSSQMQTTVIKDNQKLCGFVIQHKPLVIGFQMKIASSDGEQDIESENSDLCLAEDEVESIIDNDDYEHLQDDLHELLSTTEAFANPDEKVQQDRDIGHKEVKVPKKELSEDEKKKENLMKKLINLGYTQKMSKQAVEKSSSLPNAIAEIKLIQEKDGKFQDMKDKKYKQWSCIECTFASNTSAQCEMCENPAPKEAAEDDVVKKQGPSEAEIKKAVEEEELESPIYSPMMACLKEREQTQQYFKTSHVFQYLFAARKGVTPIISGAVFQNREQKVCDIHLIRFKYSNEYRKLIETDYLPGGVNTMRSKEKFEEILDLKKSTVESYYPALIGSELHKKTRHMKVRTLRPSKIGTVRLSFEEVHHVCQIGDEITEKRPMFIMVVGRKTGQEGQTTALVSVDYASRVSIISENTKVDQPITSLKWVQSSQQLLETTELGHLITKTAEFSNQSIKFTQISSTLSSSLLTESHGLILASDGSILSTLEKTQEIASPVKVEVQNVTYEDVLGMRIDPDKVTLDDLDKYEKLMQGAVTLGSSNANCKVGHVAGDIYAKHSWVSDGSHDIGSFEFEFQQPTSLIQIGVDLRFTSQNFADIKKAIDHQPKLDKIEEKEEEEMMIKKTAPKVVQNLGPFTIDKKFNGANRAESIKEEEFLPLKVKQFKGASYSASHIVSKVLFNDNQTYASNYGRPELVFQHENNSRICVSKFTVKAPKGSLGGALPLGCGLVFLADTMQPLEQTSAFANFNKEKYMQWQEERKQDSRPLRPDEPVAFFELIEDSVTVEISTKRDSRYILLKPTGFRPTFDQSMDTTPLEMEFFGVNGTSLDGNNLDAVKMIEPAYHESPVLSGYELEVAVLGSGEVIHKLNNVEVSQLRVTDDSLSMRTILQAENLAKLKGLSQVNISGAELQLKKIKGLKITLKRTEDCSWTFTSASLEAINSGSTSTSDILFDNSDIPSQFYRTCLLSPDFFAVINGQLAVLVQRDNLSDRTRLRVLSFLRKLISSDASYTDMILSQLDVNAFLHFNMFDQQNSSIIESTIDLLRCFQKNADFCNSLYEILLERVIQLAQIMPKYPSTYEAILGMLKWAAPLDLPRTYQTIMSTLYNCLIQEKLVQVQTNDVVEYRTRIASMSKELDQYPFDSIMYQEMEQKKQVEEEPSQANDLIRTVEVSKSTDNKIIDKSHVKSKQMHIISQNVNFFGEVSLHTIKFFFQQQKCNKIFIGINFITTISIFDGDKQVFFENYPEHTYYQNSVHYSLKANEENKLKVGKAIPLTISQLSLKCNTLRVVVQFDISGSNMKDSMVENECVLKPDVLMEFYGLTASEYPESDPTYLKALQEARKTPRFLQIGQSIKVHQGKEGQLVPIQSKNDSPDLIKIECSFCPFCQQALLFDEDRNKTNCISCDSCKKGGIHDGMCCADCDFDVCKECHNKAISLGGNFGSCPHCQSMLCWNPTRAKKNTIRCDQCSTKQIHNGMACEPCDYDLCANCHKTKFKTIETDKTADVASYGKCPTCNKELSYDVERCKRNSIYCDICGKNTHNAVVCKPCDYDLCRACRKANVPGSFGQCGKCSKDLIFDKKRAQSGYVRCNGGCNKSPVYDAACCKKCDWDICAACRLTKKQSESTTTQFDEEEEVEVFENNESSLDLVQDELRGELLTLGAEEQDIKVIKQKVKAIMGKLGKVQDHSESVYSLRYLIKLATDFQKMIQFLQYPAKNVEVKEEVEVFEEPLALVDLSSKASFKWTEQCGATNTTMMQFPQADLLKDKPYSSVPHITRIQYDIGSHIRCFQVTMSDGTTSPKAGGFSLDKSVDLAGKEIGSIVFQKMTKENTIGLFALYDRKGHEIVKMKGSMGNPDESSKETVKLAVNEKLIGFKSHHNSNVVYGMQFMIASSDSSVSIQKVRKLKFNMSHQTVEEKIISTYGELCNEASFNETKMREILQQVAMQSDLSTMCLDFFSRLVVNEIGADSIVGLRFIQSVVLYLMNEEERVTFYFKAIEKFLIEPQVHYSQAAVVTALNEFDLPLADLVSYLATRINLDCGQQKQEFFKSLSESEMANPIPIFVVVSSLLQRPVDRAVAKYLASGASVSQELQDEVDSVYRIMVKTLEWISQDDLNLCAFEKADKTVLLGMVLSTLRQIGKVVSPRQLKVLGDEQFNSLQASFVQLLTLHDKQLLTVYNLATIELHQLTLDKATETVTAKKDDSVNLEQSIDDILDFKQALNKLYDNVLNCLISMELEPAKAKNNPEMRELVQQCEESRAVWLQNVNFTIDIFIENLNTQKSLRAVREQLTEKEFESVEKVGSAVDLVKRFFEIIDMLSHNKLTNNFKHSSQIWALTLRSLRIVQTKELTEQIFDSLIQAFMVSSEEIQATTYPQLLQISEQIAQETPHGGNFLVKLLCSTLKSESANFNSVIFTVCQSWLDIIKTSTCTNKPKSEGEKWSVYSSLEASDVKMLLEEATRFLVVYLNFGNFEGSAGANKLVVRRLTMAQTMLDIAWNAFDQNKLPAIAKLFTQGNDADLKGVFDGLLLWLFLNEEDGVASTPATQKVKEITNLIHPVMMFISDSEKNTEAIMIALSSLVNLVKGMNEGIIKQVTGDNMGVQTSHRFSTRTSKLFQKMLQQWLVSTEVCQFYVFELNGFNFLLDTIGTLSQNIIKPVEESPIPTKKFSIDQFAGSDLLSMMSQLSKEPCKTSTTLKPMLSNKKTSAVTEVEGSFDDNCLKVEEFGTQMELVQETFDNNHAEHRGIDWAKNKKVYKERILIKYYNDTDCHEHHMTFKLRETAELREIQVGFTSYWESNAEVYLEPMSVLVQAGMDLENLVHVCNLDFVDDPAFNSSACSQVFGKNLRQFSCSGKSAEEATEEIQQLLARKLESVYNFQCQYIRFSFRKNVLACLENSPLVNRLHSRKAFGINYISVAGINLGELDSNRMTKFVLKQQKSSALEVMSLIFGGRFDSVQKTVANNEQTIRKIKKQFDLWILYFGKRQSIIEPTLIGISTHNVKMCDWIIQKFLNQENITIFTPLIGKLLVCDPQQIATRMEFIQQKILKSLLEIKVDKQLQSKRLEQILPLVDTYIRCMHLVSPGLKEHSQIDLHVTENVLIDVCHLLNTGTQERERQTEQLLSLVYTILAPPYPFYNSLINTAEFCQNFLLKEDSSTQTQQIAVSLACANTQTALFIFNQKIMYNQLFTMENPNIAVPKFWLRCAHNEQIRTLLQEEEVPIKLYSMIRVEDSFEEKRLIIKEGSVEYKKIIVQLILKLTSGHNKSETTLANRIIKDINELAEYQDDFFINDVLLPFIKNEHTLPVSFIQQELGQGWSPNYDLLTATGEVSTSKAFNVEENKSFVPSELLETAMRKTLLSGFTEIVGKVSKSKLDVAMKSKWECVHSQTETRLPESMFRGFWDSIAEKTPLVFLCKGKESHGKTVILGAYTSGKIPPVSSNLMQSEEEDFSVALSPDDFMFMYVQDHGTFFMRAEEENYIYINTDYDGGGALKICNFLTQTFSHNWNFSAGTKDYLQQIKLDGVPKQEKSYSETNVTKFTLEKLEVWLADKKQKAPTAESGLNLKQKVNQSICMLSENSRRHPWICKTSPFNNFRTRPVFMVPAHLTMRQLAQIVLSRGVSLSCNNIALPEDTPLAEIYSQAQHERSHNVLDLGFTIEGILALECSEQDGPMSADVRDAEEFAVRVSALYKPKNGFFDSFEQQGGVKIFIQAAIVSLKLWDDSKMAEMWRLWLKELESFSDLPLFFQMFLKNKRCKDLLFKILAGEPNKNMQDYAFWEEEAKTAVQFNFKVLSEAFSVADDVHLREEAVKADFLPRILTRMEQMTGEKTRTFEQGIEDDEEESPVIKLERKKSYTKNTDKKARKGTGYDTNVGEVYDIQKHLNSQKLKNDQIKTLVDIITNFLNSDKWHATQEVLDDLLESALLPTLENAFRNGSWLDMSKEAELFHSYYALTRAISKHKILHHALIELDKQYKPVQKDPIYKLLGELNRLAGIYSTISGQQEASESSKTSQDLVNDVMKTHNIVQDAIEDILAQNDDDDWIEDALHLPIELQYRKLLETIRFDYTEITKHHWQSLINSNKTPPAAKMVRLAQELADLSNALPTEHTNAIFVRVDRKRVDVMKAMLSGAIGTPYAHGLFEYDIFFENTYPVGPPKMNLTTTGNGQIRFNPNLYSCGKVCLSLLGTWRGHNTENWDQKISTTLQVLLSTQAIVMSDEVYFNEPGFEHEAGTPEGERKNEGYMNIVRYGNVKWAMVGHLKAPPTGFETVIKRHFYIKKAEILHDCYAWIDLSKKNEASYKGLIGDHNRTLANMFQESTTRYKEKLTEVVKELEDLLNKLDKPSGYQIKPKQEDRKRQRKAKKEQEITEGQAKYDEIDMQTDSEEEDSGMINTSVKKDKKVKAKVMDIEDEAVKDQWSRYIGAMGVEAVAKQAKANVFLSGAGALGIEISKNLVLAGCKSFTLHDTAPLCKKDLSGQFFLSETDKQPTRSEACFNRLQQLNFYVKCNCAPSLPLPKTVEALEQEPWNFQHYDVVILTEADYETIIAVNEYCHAKAKKFISCDAVGVFGRVFNDFGPSFEVMDKNGEELVDVMIKSISREEEGVVELIETVKHKFEDGDEVLFSEVKGMQLKEGEKQEMESDSINYTIHKVKVVNPYCFKIGDTRKFTEYESNGIGKQLRTKIEIKFKPFKEVMLKGTEELPSEMNLAFADFEKIENNQLAHLAFEALDQFKAEKKAMPKPWDLEDASHFLELSMKIAERYELKPAEWKEDGLEYKLLHLFAFTCQGVFNPLCAFFGGFVAQEVIKAITNKFSPTNQLFYYDASEVLPDFDFVQDSKKFTEYVKKLNVKEIQHRSDGMRICIGGDLIQKLAECRLFMVGAGAIGCELLKNYAMCGIGTDKAKGKIILTDPDIIEVSNLNRQFLFREKHLRTPKSTTAAAAATHMNKELTGNIVARLDKVHEGTGHIFNDKFFEDLTIVTNALDNVKARLYIDARCVTAQTPLLESGTLGPKGHVQVVLPNLTESYGSQVDPEDNNEIPICTLKMFPEETLHCIEWAKDKFGKIFTLMPKSAQKILEQGKSINPQSESDIKSLKEGLKLLKKRPENFGDCVAHARLEFEKLFNHDIKQLLHVYPLGAKTKEGSPFWSLPKRPPQPTEFDKENLVHCSFINSLACLFARMFFVEIPSKTPRVEAFKRECGEKASNIKVPDFKPDVEKAKSILNSVDNAEKDKKKEEGQEQEESKQEQEEVNVDEIEKKKDEFLEILSKLPLDKDKSFEEYLVFADEFEKDNDANFHIDFMCSMGNCRAENYKLTEMDWITVKLKAGRIVPALATTTACVAGLQTLELIKIVKGAKKIDHRNIFLNLAVPMLQASEPGDVMKDELLEGLSVSLWDRWDLKSGEKTRLRDVVKHVETTYEGLEVRDIMRGSEPLYFHALMTAPGKEKESKKALDSTVHSLTESYAEDVYVDLLVTCIKKGDPEAKILKGVPPVRVWFK